MVKVDVLLKVLLHPSYTTIMNGQSHAIIYLMIFFNMTYSMVALHSLDDDLRIESMCHQKIDDALRPQYLKTTVNPPSSLTSPRHFLLLVMFHSTSQG